MRRLTLYSRPDCHLCELLVADLMPLLSPDIQLDVVDISDDIDLTRRYGLRIPVLLEKGQELSSYPLDKAHVRAHLALNELP